MAVVWDIRRFEFGFLRRNLRSDERLGYRARLHWVVLLWPSLLLAASPFLVIHLHPLFLLALFCGLAFGSRQLLSYLTSEIGVTNQRLLFQIGGDKWKLSLSEVRGVEVRQTHLGRRFNYGDLLIVGPSRPLQYLSCRTVRAPRDLCAQVLAAAAAQKVKNQMGGRLQTR